EFGWAAGLPELADQFSSPSQDVIRTPVGVSFSRPSQNTPPSDVLATLVKIVFRAMVAIAFGFVSRLVPGATPKKPNSGLIARNTPWESKRIHAISSPTHSTR